MRRQSATAHELARVEMLAGLPGETLARLGESMQRDELGPGEAVGGEDADGGRFYVVLAGILSAHDTHGTRRLLRPGDAFGEAAAGRSSPRVTAVTPAVIASCDRDTFDHLVRPLLA